MSSRLPATSRPRSITLPTAPVSDSRERGLPVAVAALYGSYRLILHSLLVAGVLLAVIPFWLLVCVLGRMLAAW